MKLVKADTRRLSASELVDKSAYVEEKMTGNVNFATPVPAIASLTAARTALSTALVNARSGAHADTVVKNQAKAVLQALLAALVRYVNSVSAGNADVAVSSGFELSKQPDPVDKLNAPVLVSAKVSSFIGAVDMDWEPVRGARMYHVYISAGDPADEKTWTLAGVSSRTRHTVTDLEPGKFYNFRITALGRVGEGPASENIGSRAA